MMHGKPEKKKAKKGLMSGTKVEVEVEVEVGGKKKDEKK